MQLSSGLRPPCSIASRRCAGASRTLPFRHTSAPSPYCQPGVLADSVGRQLCIAASVATDKQLEAQGAASASTPVSPRADDKVDVSETILLQGFGWSSCTVGGWYNIVRRAVSDIKAAGFTHVWLPPPSASVSREGYLPSALYKLDTPYGSKQELKALCAELANAGVAPVADIVVNHRSAGARGPDGRWNQFTDDEDHPGARLDWGPWAITGNDPDFGGTGSSDSGADYGPAPDIDHHNPEVRRGLTDWLNWLAADIGFQGWRFDYVKGYGAQFIADYVHNTLGPDVFHVAEFWTDLDWRDDGLAPSQDGARQCLCDYLDKSKASAFMFDFPTKGVLNEAMGKRQYWRLKGRDGKPPGLVGWWPERAVLFTDNHDTGSTQQHWPFPADLMDQGYAYVLTHPGVPSVLWEHYFDWGLKDKIDGLIALRRRNGIKSGSKIKILCAEEDMYVATIGDRVTIKIGPRFDMGGLVPKEDKGWKFAMSGTDWAVWEKAA